MVNSPVILFTLSTLNKFHLIFYLHTLIPIIMCIVKSDQLFNHAEKYLGNASKLF